MASPSLYEPMGKLQAKAAQTTRDDVALVGVAGRARDSRDGEGDQGGGCLLSLFVTHLMITEGREETMKTL